MLTQHPSFSSQSLFSFSHSTPHFFISGLRRIQHTCAYLPWILLLFMSDVQTCLIKNREKSATKTSIQDLRQLFCAIHGCVMQRCGLSPQITSAPCVFFSIVASWEVNAIGHPVVLPLNVCEELQRVIDKSNATLPASMRHMRSYEVRAVHSKAQVNWTVFMVFAKEKKKTLMCVLRCQIAVTMEVLSFIFHRL